MQIKFDDISVPKEKLEQIVNQNMYEIQVQYKKKKQKNYLIRGTVAAVIALSLAGIFTAHPTFAAKLPLIGHIFERVQSEQMFPGNFDEVAEPVTGSNISQSGGVTMTLSEIYCDSRALYVSAMIESEEPFPAEVKESNMLEGSDIGYHMYLWVESQEFDFMTLPDTFISGEWPDENFEWMSLDLKGEYIDEHTFVGALRIDFSIAPIAFYEIPNEFHWKLRVNSMRNQCYTKDGAWEFETDVTVDWSGIKVIDVNENLPNGRIIHTVTLTPYEIYVDDRIGKTEPGFERYDSIQSIMLDADGRRIEDRVGHFSPVLYNMSKLTMYFFATPTEEVHDAIFEKVHTLPEEQLRDYLEEIVLRKIEIDLGDYYCK